MRTHVTKTPARAKRDRAKKQREETRWARKSGPVVTRQATPEELAALRKTK